VSQRYSGSCRELCLLGDRFCMVFAMAFFAMQPSTTLLHTLPTARALAVLFRRQEHLKRHYRSLHTHDKPFECTDCDEKFSRSDNLSQHQRTQGILIRRNTIKMSVKAAQYNFSIPESRGSTLLTRVRVTKASRTFLPDSSPCSSGPIAVAARVPSTTHLGSCRRHILGTIVDMVWVHRNTTKMFARVFQYNAAFHHSNN
jgi:hypothetical protein